MLVTNVESNKQSNKRRVESFDDQQKSNSSSHGPQRCEIDQVLEKECDTCYDYYFLSKDSRNDYRAFLPKFLHIVCEKRKYSLLKKICDVKDSPEKADLFNYVYKNRTPLQICVENNDIRGIDMLLRQSLVDIFKVPKGGVSAFQASLDSQTKSETLNTEELSKFIDGDDKDENELLLNDYSKYLENPESKTITPFKLLLFKLNSIIKSITSSNDYKLPNTITYKYFVNLMKIYSQSMIKSIDTQNYSALHLMLSTGISYKKISEFPEFNLPIFAAVYKGDINLIRMLIKHNTNFALSKKFNQIPIHILAAKGFLTTLKLIITEYYDKSKPPPNQPDTLDSNTRLIDCEENPQMNQNLIKNDEPVLPRDCKPEPIETHESNEQRTEKRWPQDYIFQPTQDTKMTVLHFAALNNNPNTLKYLLSLDNAHDYLNERNKNGSTPLLCASSKGNLECLKFLLSLEKTDLLIGDLHGNTPIVYATYYNREECAKELLIAISNKLYALSHKKYMLKGSIDLLNYSNNVNNNNNLYDNNNVNMMVENDGNVTVDKDVNLIIDNHNQFDNGKEQVIPLDNIYESISKIDNLMESYLIEKRKWYILSTIDSAKEQNFVIDLPPFIKQQEMKILNYSIEKIWEFFNFAKLSLDNKNSKIPTLEIKINGFERGSGVLRQWLKDAAAHYANLFLFKKLYDYSSFHDYNVTPNEKFKCDITPEKYYLYLPYFHETSEAALDQMKKFGLFLAVSFLYNPVFLPLSPIFFKTLLDEKIILEDIMPTYILLELQKMRTTYTDENFETLCQTMTISSLNSHGEIEVFELIEGGKDTLLTRKNLDLYEDRLLYFFTKAGYREELLKAFKYGFYRFLDESKFHHFLTSPELITLILKKQECITVKEWKPYTKLTHSEQTEPDEFTWFWEYVDKCSLQKQSKLIEFACGSPILPLGNFKTLFEDNHPFTLQYSPNVVDVLPWAFTCTYTLHIPKYSTKQLQFHKFDIALENFQGFQFV